MKIGDVVISTYGHDTGEWYIIQDMLNEYVFLIDGHTKTVNKPKKKKSKHIIKTAYFAKDIAIKLNEKQNIQNAEIRKALKFFKNN